MLYKTITMIGMPGAGKSTVGVLLAKRVGLNFVDSDLLIQVREDQTLQQILDSRGHLALRAIEEAILLDMPLAGYLVATGGSAVYSEASMSRFRDSGPVVYLAAALESLTARVQAHPDRGIAAPPGQDFAAVYAERVPLYERHATLTVAADSAPAEAVAEMIARELGFC